MERQKYGLGKQDFESLRKRGFVYIDKTRYIINLLEGADYYFLSRPRRFGKSLFLSTLENFFLGRRELFKGLAVDSYYWDWREYPVIRINLGEGSYSQPDGLRQRLIEVLEENELKYDIAPVGDTPRSRLRNLIIKLHGKFNLGVVVLIDEYEKPLLDSIQREHFTESVDVISEFYSVLKSNEERIKFLFITGVTKFGHLNIFSGFNNLNDISLDDDFSAICGITDLELLDNLRPGIERLARAYNLDFDGAVESLKKYYDGYHFSRELIDIFNPFSLLTCLNASRFTSKWFQTGSSRYLLDQLKANKYNLSNLEGIKASEDTLAGVDASMRDSVTLLFQSGYLTIKHYDTATTLYTLGIPNFEVKTALYSAIVPYYLGSRYNDTRVEAYDFISMLNEGKALEAMKWLQGYFSGIPQDIKLDYENEFQQVIYAFFALSGQLSGATLEKKTSDGRIDMVYETPGFVYVFEFKRGENPQVAMAQINSKKYALQWQADGRQVIKIGVAFSPKSRGIADFLIDCS